MKCNLDKQSIYVNIYPFNYPKEFCLDILQSDHPQLSFWKSNQHLNQLFELIIDEKEPNSVYIKHMNFYLNDTLSWTIENKAKWMIQDPNYCNAKNFYVDPPLWSEYSRYFKDSKDSKDSKNSKNFKHFKHFKPSKDELIKDYYQYIELNRPFNKCLEQMIEENKTADQKEKKTILATYNVNFGPMFINAIHLKKLSKPYNSSVQIFSCCKKFHCCPIPL